MRDYQTWKRKEGNLIKINKKAQFSWYLLYFSLNNIKGLLKYKNQSKHVAIDYYYVIIYQFNLK